MLQYFIRNGNGHAIEGVWMLCSALFCQMGKINYRDEAFTHVVNAIAKWPYAYRLMYQRNKTVNLDGRHGKQLAGDEWVEDYLVKPVKQFTSAQSSFSMVELMSCSVNLLEMNRNMYKGKEAFDIHHTKKHKKPSSLYDQIKVAQFAIRETWFECKQRKEMFISTHGLVRKSLKDKLYQKSVLMLCLKVIKKPVRNLNHFYIESFQMKCYKL